MSLEDQLKIFVSWADPPTWVRFSSAGGVKKPKSKTFFFLYVVTFQTFYLIFLLLEASRDAAWILVLCSINFPALNFVRQTRRRSSSRQIL